LPRVTPASVSQFFSTCTPPPSLATAAANTTSTSAAEAPQPPILTVPSTGARYLVTLPVLTECAYSPLILIPANTAAERYFPSVDGDSNRSDGEALAGVSVTLTMWTADALPGAPGYGKPCDAVDAGPHVAAASRFPGCRAITRALRVVQPHRVPGSAGAANVTAPSMFPGYTSGGFAPIAPFALYAALYPDESVQHYALTVQVRLWHSPYNPTLHCLQVARRSRRS
jgi:hypothetical protein